MTTSQQSFLIKENSHEKIKPNSMRKQESKRVSDAKTKPYVSVVSGAISGVVSRFIIAPFDVIKIRLQIQTNRIGDPNRKYTGMFNCFKTILREEGIRGLWKGNISAEYLYLSYGALQFLSYTETQSLIRRLTANGEVIIPPKIESYVAGAVAGFIATTGTYPFDLLRTRFAAQSTNHVYIGIMQAIRHIYITDGLSGFYRGISPALLQLVPYTALVFGTYTFTKRTLANIDHERLTIASMFLQSNSVSIKAAEEFLCGGLAGIFSKVGIFPFDVIRKRMQMCGHGQFNLKDVQHISIWNIFLAIIRNEGYLALYKGLLPGLIKAAPASAVTFAVYEQTKRLLEWMNDESSRGL